MGLKLIYILVVHYHEKDVCWMQEGILIAHIFDCLGGLQDILLFCSYFTNTLILPAVNGPTEGLMLIYVAHCFTAIVGMLTWPDI